MYLELARLLNVDLNSCIVFAESISGVRAAVTAQKIWKMENSRDFEAVDLD